MNGKKPLELRFHLGPIPVAVDLGFWVMTAVLGINAGSAKGIGLWVAVVFVSVLVHELGHALAAMAFGTRASIRLYAMGGLTMPEQRLSRWRDVLMSLAGPFAGFLASGLVAGLALLLRPENALAQEAVQDLIWVNFGWGLFNLLPVLPLDGGRVLMGVLGAKHQVAALVIGGTLAAAVAVLAGFARQLLGIAPQLWIALLFGMLAFQNFQAWWQLKHQPAPGAPQILVGDALQKGWDALRRGEDGVALQIGRAVLDQAQDPVARNHARDLIAWADLARNDHRDALRQLERSEPPEAARPLTWAMVLEALGEPNQASPYALRAIEVEPSETAASLAVRVLSAARRFDEARAVVEKFPWQREAAREAAQAELDFAHGDFAEAARHYQAAFEQGGAAGDAYNVACSQARAGSRELALAWLERALKAGFDDRDRIREDKDLALLHGSPELERLLGGAPHA